MNVFISALRAPAVMRQAFDIFEAQNPGIRIQLQIAGNSGDSIAQYLSTVLSSKDASMDAYMIESARPAQFATAG